jgi:hypothetical protein
MIERETEPTSNRGRGIPRSDVAEQTYAALERLVVP